MLSKTKYAIALFFHAADYNKTASFIKTKINQSKNFIMLCCES